MGVKPLYSAPTPSSRTIVRSASTTPAYCRSPAPPATFMRRVLTTSAGVDVHADATPAMPLAPMCASALSPTTGARRDFASSYVPSSAALTRNVRATFGCSPDQNARTPPSACTRAATARIVVASAAVCICVLSTSVGLKTAIESAPAVPPAARRCAKLGRAASPPPRRAADERGSARTARARATSTGPAAAARAAAPSSTRRRPPRPRSCAGSRRAPRSAAARAPTAAPAAGPSRRPSAASPSRRSRPRPTTRRSAPKRRPSCSSRTNLNWSQEFSLVCDADPKPNPHCS